MIEINDQMNRTIRLEQIPMRIVSLVPSQTELLAYLGAADRVVGITKFCIHPNEWYRSKTRVGGTKNVNFDAIEKLNPDLIIANKEENSMADIERLAQKYPVYISDIYVVEDAFLMMEDLGVLLQQEFEANALISQLRLDFKTLPQMQGTVLYFIWANPYMVAGENTFIGAIIRVMGLKNALTDPNSRYPEMSAEEIKTINPTYIFLSSEPYPFKEKDRNELIKLVSSEIKIVDGELFSWYGSRMLEMKKYFEKLADPYCKI